MFHFDHIFSFFAQNSTSGYRGVVTWDGRLLKARKITKMLQKQKKQLSMLRLITKINKAIGYYASASDISSV